MRKVGIISKWVLLIMLFGLIGQKLSFSLEEKRIRGGNYKRLTSEAVEEKMKASEEMVHLLLGSDKSFLLPLPISTLCL